jgi:hypothetical protein
VVNVVGKTSIMLDVEKEPLDTLAEQRELVQDIYAFADQYHAAGGRVTLAYFPHWEEQAVGSPSLTGLTSRGIGLVSSNYTTYSDSGPGWAPYGGVTPIIWQYTSTPLDTNAFKGTTAQLADLWAHGIDNTDPSVPVVPPEDIVTPAEFLAILRDPAVAAEMHALPWRYIGGGIPAGMSTLNVLNALLTSAGEAADADAAEVVRDEALAATVGDLPTTTLPPGPLSGADVDRIAAAVDALIAARAARFAS